MADISYTPTTWADGSSGGTPIDATKLNNIETGISDAVAAIGPNDTTADGTLKAQIDALGESVSKKARIGSTLLTDGRLDAYRSGDTTYVQVHWTISPTENYFLQLSTSGNAGFYKIINGTTTNIKSW